MLRNTRKFFAFALVYLIVLALFTACGKSEDQPKESNGSTSESTVKVEESTTVTAEMVELTFRCEFTGEAEKVRRDWLESNISEFETANPNYTIKADYVDILTHDNKLKIEMAGGNPPDIFRTFGFNFSRPYAMNGMLLDITDELNKDTAWKDGLQPAAIDAFNYDGKIMGIGTDGFVEGIYYHKELFNKLGLKPFETYEDFLNAVDAAKKAGIIPIAVGLKDKWSADFVTTPFFDRMAGTAVFTGLNTGTGTWVIPEYVSAIKLLQDLAKNDAFPKGAAGIAYAEARALLGNGKALMFFSGSWDSQVFYSSEFPEGTGDKIGFMNMPAIKDGKGDPKTLIAGFSPGWAVSGKLDATKTEGALKFLKVLTSTKSLENLMYSASILAGGKFEVDESKVSKLFADVVDELNTSSMGYNPYNDLMAAGIAEVWHDIGQSMMLKTDKPASPEELLAKMDKAYKDFAQ